MTGDSDIASESPERRPIGEVLPGLSVHPLDDGETAEEAFILLKVRDKDGDISWSYRTTRPPNREELLGALSIQVELLKRDILDDWLET